MGYVQLLDLSIGFCKRLPFRVHEKIQRAMICTIWLLNIANWKIPTINGGFVRWENHLFQLGPFLPWRTGYVITRLGTWDVGIIHHIHPMGILVHFSMGLDGLAHPKKKGQETQTLTFNMMGWFLVIGQDFLKKNDHLPISPNQNHGTNHDKAIWRCQPHGYQICCFIRYAGVTYRPCDIIRYPDISIHIRTFIYIYIHPLVI